MDDQHIIADLKERLKLLGLDPNQAEEIVRKSKTEGFAKNPAVGHFPIQPQRELVEARKRVHEQGTRLAKILLNHVKLEISGTEIPYKYTSLGITGRSNLIAAIMMVNNEINKRLGKERNQCSVEDFKKVLDSTDDIIKGLARQIRKVKGEYEKQNS